MIFLGWRFWGFDNFSGLVFSCGFNDFFMLEVSVEDRDFVCVGLESPKILIHIYISGSRLKPRTRTNTWYHRSPQL